MAKTVKDFKLEDAVITDYGDYGVVKQIDDQYVYVEEEDGRYAYWNPDELEIIPTEEKREYRDNVLADIKELIEQWGFTKDELFDTKS